MFVHGPLTGSDVDCHWSVVPVEPPANVILLRTVQAPLVGLAVAVPAAGVPLTVTVATEETLLVLEIVQVLTHR